MRIKFKGGPNDGKYYEMHVSDRSDDIELRIMEAPRYDVNRYLDPPVMTTVKRGRYSRSETVLKDGTPIYQWMGWKP